jgi:hypothetical protein
MTLIVSPYLYNYDFLLLLVPFAMLSSKGNPVQKIIVFLCYLLPTFALLLYGREGNITLLPVTVGMMVLLLYTRKNPVIDFTGRAAYNNTK